MNTLMMEEDGSCSAQAAAAAQGCSTGEGGEGSGSSMAVAVVPAAGAEKKTWRHELVPELRFPPGYHFLPSDEELVDVYLRAKIEGRPPPLDVIKEVEILNYLPDVLIDNYMQYGEKRWYFFTKREKSSCNKAKESRRKVHAEGEPCWKATGSVVPIFRGGHGGGGGATEAAVKIGTKRILIYRSSVPGEEEKWSMNEYVMADHDQMDQWILCTIQIKLRWDTKRKNEEDLTEEEEITNKKTKTTKRRNKGDSSQAQEETTNTSDDPLPCQEETTAEFHELLPWREESTQESDDPLPLQEQTIEEFDDPLTSRMLEHDPHRQAPHEEEEHPLTLDNDNTSIIVEHPIIAEGHHQTFNEDYPQLELVPYETSNNLEETSVTRNQPQEPATLDYHQSLQHPEYIPICSDQAGMQMCTGNAETTTSFMGQKDTSPDSVLTNGNRSAIEHQLNSGEQQAMVSAGAVDSDHDTIFGDLEDFLQI